MLTVTIALPDEPMLRLQELAKEAGVAPEELLRASIEEWLAKPKEDFAQAAAYVLTNGRQVCQMHEDALDVVEAFIRTAFSEAEPPVTADLVAENVAFYRRFEADELRRELAGKKWTEISREFIDTHSDWLTYLTPQAFRYYVPAWLVYSLDWMNADYAAQWIASILSGPSAHEPIPDYMAQLLLALDTNQRAAVIVWLTYLLAAYPEEDVGYLQTKGMAAKDIVYNLTARLTQDVNLDANLRTLNEGIHEFRDAQGLR